MKPLTVALLAGILFSLYFSFPSVLQQSWGADSPAAAGPGSPHHQQGDPLAEIERLRRDFASNPYNPAIRKNLASAVMNYGAVLLRQKRYEDAAVQFEYAEELLPDDYQPSLLRGSAAYGLKRYDLARTELERARNLGGETADVLFLLGRVFYDTGEIRQSVELWELALQKDPDNGALQELLAKAKREEAVDTGMGKGHSSRFILSYDADIRSDAADRVLNVLEDAYNRVGRDFGRYPEARVPVILYTTRDYREITGSPGWSGGQYDGKIRLPVKGLGDLSPQFRAVLVHEYTHVVVHDLTRGNCPVWLNEGLAEVEGRREYSPPLHALGQAVRDGTPLSPASLTGSFASLQGKGVDLAYQQSFSLVNYMLSAYGWHTMQDLLTLLGNGLPFAAAFERSYRDVGATFEGVVAEWREQLAREYGR